MSADEVFVHLAEIFGDSDVIALRMKALYVLLAVIAAVNGWRLTDLAREEWQIFKLEHKKRYENATEELHRLRIYLDKRRMIAKHNRRYHRGLESYSLKLNQFSDMTHQEYLEIATGFKPTSRQTSKNPSTRSKSLANVRINATVDWRQLGAVSEVRNQLDCKSCWAFSTAGALEGQLFIKKNKKLVPLSPQNLVDCSTKNNGCEGGNMLTAFEYIAENKGIDFENYYPYEGKNDICRYNPQRSGGYDEGFVQIPFGNEKWLMDVVAIVGPVSVAVNSASEKFSQYSHGVYYDKDCTDELDHAMLVVGFGTDEKEGDYWLLKNTYGRAWGEDGYMRLARNRNNHCGIASFASYPKLPP